MSTLEFTEDMKGFVTLGEADYEAGYRQGRTDKTALMFHLTITTDDVDAFTLDATHVANAEGYVECDALGGRLPVERGVFNLFVDTGDPTTKHMLYRLFFADGVGHPLTLTGFKHIHDDPGMDLWRDTSTLYTHILGGHVEADGDDSAEVVASGVITIHLTDFARQLTTFRSHGGSAGDRARALERFGRLFMGELWGLYGLRAKEAAGLI
jgi:cholesterol oxidase